MSRVAIRRIDTAPSAPAESFHWCAVCEERITDGLWMGLGGDGNAHYTHKSCALMLFDSKPLTGSNGQPLLGTEP